MSMTPSWFGMQVVSSLEAVVSPEVLPDKEHESEQPGEVRLSNGSQGRGRWGGHRQGGTETRLTFVDSTWHTKHGWHDAQGGAA